MSDTVTRIAAADIVISIAHKHGLDLPDHPSEELADHLSALCDLEGDDVLRLIGDLLRKGIISVEQANHLTLAHMRETRLRAYTRTKHELMRHRRSIDLTKTPDPPHVEAQGNCRPVRYRKSIPGPLFVGADRRQVRQG
ncbi:hypothetical protein ASG42_10885 [Rhizobium sp. Leaf391]|uniref:hypothetical protein n=1 Tax=Rhizobium sp. Leaf391 TaxID=1736360 RepID=UPI000715BF31|nr:hypothetical protein [Rhizobium sp. Leaf391]KQS90994.1 hypothetical protein ASG42_10885 [Rhizobium sp. Leaf391]